MVGVRVPVGCHVAFERVEYSTLALPFWVDHLVDASGGSSTTTIRATRLSGPNGSAVGGCSPHYTARQPL